MSPSAGRSPAVADGARAARGEPGQNGDRSGAIEVRRLGYPDLPQVIAIERRVFPTPWSLAMFVLELSKPAGICLAAERDGRLVGYTICSRYDRVWHIMNIAVDLPERRRGVATALLERLLAEAGTSARYTLEVRPSNRPAIAMYERFGFHAAGRRRAYYHDNREDAVVMWRGIGEDPISA